MTLDYPKENDFNFKLFIHIKSGFTRLQRLDQKVPVLLTFIILWNGAKKWEVGCNATPLQPIQNVWSHFPGR